MKIENDTTVGLIPTSRSKDLKQALRKFVNNLDRGEPDNSKAYRVESFLHRLPLVLEVSK